MTDNLKILIIRSLENDDVESCYQGLIDLDPVMHLFRDLSPRLSSEKTRRIMLNSLSGEIKVGANGFVQNPRQDKPLIPKNWRRIALIFANENNVKYGEEQKQ
jgi:hypothetical protein